MVVLGESEWKLESRMCEILGSATISSAVFIVHRSEQDFKGSLYFDVGLVWARTPQSLSLCVEQF